MVTAHAANITGNNHWNKIIFLQKKKKKNAQNIKKSLLSKNVKLNELIEFILYT